MVLWRSYILSFSIISGKFYEKSFKFPHKATIKNNFGRLGENLSFFRRIPHIDAKKGWVFMTKPNEKKALLDKAVFGGLQIVAFKNMDRLVADGIVEVSSSPTKYVTARGQEFTRLRIQDDLIDKMVAGSKWIKGKKVDYCNLAVTIINDEVGNLVCYTVDQYKAYLDQIKEYLMDQYGILVAMDGATLKEIEINRTFRLKGDFKDYHRAINLLMVTLPPRWKKQMLYREINNQVVDYQTYYATTNKTQNSKRYAQFKIYDKTRQLKHIVKLKDYYMRVEFRLIGTEMVKKSLGTNRLAELTDERINEYFDRQIEKMIVQPYKKWKAARDKAVVDLMIEQRKKDIRHWQTNVLHLLADKEIDHYWSMILSMGELLPLVNKLGLNSKRTSDIKQNFMKQAQKYQRRFCTDDDKKLSEIIEKMTAREAFGEEKKIA